MINFWIISTLSIIAIIYFASKSLAYYSKGNDESIYSLYKNKYLLGSVGIFTFFMGLRYGVGRDYFHYVDLYNNAFNLDFDFGKSYEFGHSFVVEVLNGMGLDVQWYFLITSFITIILIYKSVRDELFILPLLLFFVFYGDFYGFFLSGIRQGIAIASFIFALRYFNKNDSYRIINNSLMIFIFFAFGALFHYSILLVIPFALLLNTRLISFFSSKVLVIIVFSGLFISELRISNAIIDILISSFPRYYGYGIIYSNLMGIERASFGLANTVLFLTNIVPLFFYDKIVQQYPNARIHFVLFAIGYSIFIAFGSTEITRRMVLYLFLNNVFVFPYFLKYLKFNTKRKFEYVIITFVICLIFFVKDLYYFPHFFDSQITKNKYSIWLIDLE